MRFFVLAIVILCLGCAGDGERLIFHCRDPQGNILVAETRIHSGDRDKFVFHFFGDQRPDSYSCMTTPGPVQWPEE